MGRRVRLQSDAKPRKKSPVTVRKATRAELDELRPRIIGCVLCAVDEPGRVLRVPVGGAASDVLTQHYERRHLDELVAS